MILAASIAEGAGGQDLINKLGLPEDTYWVASNGVAVPVTEFSAAVETINEVFILRDGANGLEPVGWYEISETNVENAFSSARQLTVDGAAPAASLSLSGPWLIASDGSTLAAPDAHVVVTFADEAGVDDWQLMEGDLVVSTESRWAPGQHQLTVQASDTLGNSGYAGELAFSVDASGPELDWQIVSEVLAQGPHGPVYSPPVSIHLNASDNAGVATMEINDGSGWRGVANNTTVSIQTQQYQARATDGLGNVSEEQGHWRYDLEAPVITVSVMGRVIGENDEIALSVGGTIDIIVSDDGVGVADASYRYNRKPRRPLPKVIRFVDRGWYQIQIVAVDKLGNERTRHVDVRTSPRAYRPKRAGVILGDQP